MNDFVVLTNVLVPVGSIIAFAGNVEKYKADNTSNSPFTTQPVESFGWMLCDGAAISASEYPELYAVLGNLYGHSSSENDILFNLPDLRGQFLRGIIGDLQGSLRDSSLDNRVAAPGGEITGVGSTQLDAFQIHQHHYNKPTGATLGDKGTAFAVIEDGITEDPTNGMTNSPPIKVSQYESRPTNVFVNYLIKYTYQLPTLIGPHY